MAANFNAPKISEPAASENMKVGDGGAAPGGDEEMAVAAEDDAVGVVTGGKALNDLARLWVSHREAIAYVLRHINELAARCNRNAAGIARARAVGRLHLGQFQFTRERRLAIFPRVNKEHIGVAAGDVERVAVGRERSAKECAVLEECLRNLPCLQIDDLDTLLTPTAEHHHSLVAAERGHDIERHAAELYRITHAIEADAGRERRGKSGSLRERRC